MAGSSAASTEDPIIVVTSATEVFRGAVPAIKNVPGLRAARVATASTGLATCRCWILPGDGDENHAALSQGAWDQLGLTGEDSEAITLSDLDTDELTVVRAPAARMNRAWWVGPRHRPARWAWWQRPERSVLSIEDRWLIVESWSAPCHGDEIELNRFQMDLLGIDRPSETRVQCSPLGVPPTALPAGEGSALARRLRTAWRWWATFWEWLMRLILGAPEMSMVITLGTQGDDQQTVRVDPAILPFLGVAEGDVLVVRGASGRALVTAVAQGVPNDFVDTQIVPPHECRQLRQQDKQMGVVPNLLISVPAPVREDIGEFCGSVVRVRRRALRVIGRNALTLVSPVFTGVIAWLAATNASDPGGTAGAAASAASGVWSGQLIAPIIVAAVTLVLVLKSLRHKAPKPGPWP